MRKYLQLKFYLYKEVRSYIYGFLLAILLTIIPFLIVKCQYFQNDITRFITILCALIQIIVHFIFFLHLNDIQKNSWYLISLLFISVIIFIVVFGSIWIMFNLNHHVLM